MSEGTVHDTVGNATHTVGIATHTAGMSRNVVVCCLRLVLSLRRQCTRLKVTENREP